MKVRLNVELNASDDYSRGYCKKCPIHQESHFSTHQYVETRISCPLGYNSVSCPLEPQPEEGAKEWTKEEAINILKQSKKYCVCGCDKTLEMVIKALESETKTANWIWDKDGMDWNIGVWCCSSCGMKAETYWSTNEKINPLKFAGSHFCGNCGAKMQNITNS